MPVRAVVLLAAVLVLSGSTGVRAQTAQKNPLAAVKALKCTFTLYSTVKWKSGVPQAEVRTAQMGVDIDEIDADSGTARVDGSGGPVYVTALLTASSLHFMERSVTGTLNVTTVFVPGSAGQKLRAVQSRHDYLPMSIPGFESEPTVSQNYGTCEATR